MNNKVALIYDFDKTLSPKDMQEYGFFKMINVEEPSEFWDEVKELSIKNKMDSILTYMYVMLKRYPNLKKQDLIEAGSKIQLYDGVLEWFDRINKYGQDKGLIIEHYIISSGLQEMINGTKIQQYFNKIYACSFYYDNDLVKWPARVVNYTTKTQYLFRINKGILDESNDIDLNKATKEEQKYIPFENMIYIGDGFTDVPCMKIVKANNGYTIAVYDNNVDKLAKQLLDDKRAMFITSANYKENAPIDIIVKKILDLINIKNNLYK